MMTMPPRLTMQKHGGSPQKRSVLARIRGATCERLMPPAMKRNDVSDSFQPWWRVALIEDRCRYRRHTRNEATMASRKKSIPMADKPATIDCPKCRHINKTGDARTLQVEMRPVLTKQVFAFPDAL